jgi:hypothetical protein
VAHLVAQASWALGQGRPGGKVAAAAARRLLRHGIDLVSAASEAEALATDAALLAGS